MRFYGDNVAQRVHMRPVGGDLQGREARFLVILATLLSKMRPAMPGQRRVGNSAVRESV